MTNAPLHVDTEVKTILETLQRNGYEAYIVGGAVRDLLLGIEPKDYDIATAATPEEIKTLFGRKARIIGRRFRLVHVYRGKNYYEVSTFRREPSDEERRGRDGDDGVMIWRDNQYGCLEDDARRRDFTVNAIYYDPVTEQGIVDHCGGVQDLNQRIVRAIGTPAQRLAEDPVRQLRALKLVAQYGFSMEPELAEAVRRQAPEIDRTSRARRYEELLKIYAKPYAARTFATFHQTGFLEWYLPAMQAAWETPSGQLMRALLAERDRRKATRNFYSGSRTLAIATTVVAAVAEDLGCNLHDRLWEHEPGIETLVRNRIYNLFEPLPIPKILTARTRDVILALPRLQTHAHKKRTLHHPEYRYTRELFSLLTTVCGWDPELIRLWPTQGTAKPGRRKRLRQKHVKRSHRKEWE